MKNFSLDEYLKKLEDIVNIDSGSNIKNGPQKVAEYMTILYKNLGLNVIKRDGASEYGPCLEIRNEYKNLDEIDILFSGHMDTVFPERTTQKRPFKRAENLAFGPGVADMKAGLISMYYVVKTILEKKMPLNFCIILNSDEEISSKRSEKFIKELAKKSKYAFIFEPGRKNGSFVCERKGISKYDVKFYGISAHAGVAPENGASAINELANFILEAIKLNNYEKGTTLNVGVISGGTTVNVVSEYAECQIDTRFEQIEENNKLELALTKLADYPKDQRVKISLTREAHRPPMLMNKETEKLLLKMKEIGNSLDMDVSWVKTGGGSDGNFISFEGCIAIDGVGPSGDNYHSEKEVLFIDSIEPRLNLIIKTIEYLANKI